MNDRTGYRWADGGAPARRGGQHKLPTRAVLRSASRRMNDYE